MIKNTRKIKPMEENSIIRAMAASGHTTTADVGAILQERITQLEATNTQLLAAIVRRDDEIDRLNGQVRHYATQMGRWWQQYGSPTRRRGQR